MNIPRQVRRLIRKYGTNDPIIIAERMGIVIEYRYLVGILGFFHMYSRIPFIHVHQELSENMIRFVVAHELAHRLLHPKVNVPFLSQHSLQSKWKIEREANQFAVELLIPDKLLLEGATIYEAATISGVPQEVAHLKQVPDKSFWRDETSFMTW